MPAGGFSRFQRVDEQIDRLGAAVDAALPATGGDVIGNLAVSGTVTVGTTGILSNPATNVVAASGPLQTGGKNSMAILRLCGRKATTGAPASGTWAVGDAVMDSAGLWWYCTVAGTPGTWVGAV